MTSTLFFKSRPSSTLAEIAAATGAELVDPARADVIINGIASLDEAGPMHLSFFENLRYESDLATTRAGACLVSSRFEGRVPAHVAVLRSKRPFHAFVAYSRQIYADALRPQPDFGASGIAPTAVIHPSARLEDEVIVEPLAVIGPDVEIGSGTVIGAGAVLASGVKIGRDCNIGPGSHLQHTLIGNNVLIHPGCHIGQDGFGFIFAGRHTKVPQTGRVIIQNDVELGAGTTVDRGSLRDTVIGEGTKVDNQVQIGHNVTIGRHCVIAAKCGLAGSLTLGDNVALGAMVGINNHVVIGDGAQVAAMSGVKDSVPPGERWGGMFARPTKTWFREMLAVRRLAEAGSPDAAGSQPEHDKDEGRG
ncbi:UDP-3-O-(3-hydroxymyristoyl)glucosamine N-acyltransferase [Rhodopseudomonas sp. HC1]|uniref:UDP-3-O-(3-hydroxymyristoyl)glucosamine N-acyltransferase n=1 Tax=Rhodopseudomonas infernalis TaxID=2897386 RepID=UPI001EE793F3|nr:UDP-3-O-(3-hydroxymyristoyl)glucosamine N-acyltransferase [Rhodopseudomonas infernalis]MCG6206894.1 UDP-3-O-(3-hydroxymyristoyl)glucosamine N-acyltransferase [Rhodopseudomonas infernalis]